MSLKTKRHDQGTTEMFILELEKERSLWNGMSEIQEPQCGKIKFQKIS